MKTEVEGGRYPMAKLKITSTVEDVGNTKQNNTKINIKMCVGYLDYGHIYIEKKKKKDE